MGKADFSELNGSHVVCWPDNDDAGRAAMTRAMKLAFAAGEKSCRVVTVPSELPKGWDLGDSIPSDLDLRALLAGAQAPKEHAGLRRFVLSAKQLAELPLPRREYLIEPFLPNRSLSMLYAERGIGKTHLALHLASCVATGEAFLGFKVAKAASILYVDGEMSLSEMQERAKGWMSRNPTNFMLLPSELLHLNDKPLNISDPEDQARISQAIHALTDEGLKPSLIVFDNLSSLSAGIDENDNTALDGLLKWLVGLRHGGHAVMLVHHAGKNGMQRGASRREDLLDTSIKLVRPDYEKQKTTPHHGAHFFLEFSKTRGRRPHPDRLELRLIEDEEGLLAFQVNDAPVATSRDRTLRELALRDYKSQVEVGVALALSKASISKHVSALRLAGQLEPNSLRPTPADREHLVQIWPELWKKLEKQEMFPM